MRPVLFQIGPLTVYSFGLMMGIAFIAGNYFLSKETARKKLDPKIATEITLISIIAGIAGSKLLYLIENWSIFIKDPIGQAFTAGGLTFYGGLILTIIALVIYLKIQKIPFLVIADAASPALALAYGIGRIGCHLAGDGDYGIPTSLPWGVNYEHGTVPPSIMFSDPDVMKYYPDIVRQFPNGVPDNTLMHPTPIYEFLAAIVIFFILVKLLRKNYPDGKVFMVYLLCTGISRFFVEFIRLNPRLLFGLSEAQLISTALMLAGIAGIIYYSGKKEFVKFVPQQAKNAAQIEKNKTKKSNQKSN